MVINYKADSQTFETLPKYKARNFQVKVGENGFKYVLIGSVVINHLHISLENGKTGKVFAWNFPIEYTCKHDCACYKNKNCYACGGCYTFHSNQAKYTENLAFFLNHSTTEIVNALQFILDNNPSIKLFRAFTCGDIPNAKFIDVMRILAGKNQHIRFWFYTKKYDLVNHYTERNGYINTRNLKCIFSHWMNDDGSYYPMNNPYGYPTSEFVPLGREDLIPANAHICPCSDPNVATTCQHCENPCYELEDGQAMVLKEHSTKRTKERDKKIALAHKRIIAQRKQRKTA